MTTVLRIAFLALTVCAGLASNASDRGGTLELLDESHGPIPAVPCTMASCATVIAIRHHLGVETVRSEHGPGVYFQEEVDQNLYPAPPLAAPIDEGSRLEKETELWDIELQMQDGTVQTVQQDFSPLFSVGARVVVDGGQVQLWE